MSATLIFQLLLLHILVLLREKNLQNIYGSQVMVWTEKFQHIFTKLF